MGIERLVTVLVRRLLGAVGLASFNYPVIVTDDAPNDSFGNGRLKRYTANSLNIVGTDFGSSSETYKAFRVMVSQSRKPKYIYIGIRDAAVAQVKTVAITGSLITGQTVNLTVNGVLYSAIYNASSDATMGALATAIQTGGNGVTSAAFSTGVLTITGASEWELSVGQASVTGPGTAPTFATATTTPGRTIATDLADMFAENNAPYAVYLTSSSRGAIQAAAAYIETKRKMLFAQTQDAAVWSSANTDVLSWLKNANFTRTVINATKDATQHTLAGLLAYCFSFNPGGIAFHNNEVIGVTPDDFTDDQLGYIDAKNGNSYVNVYGDVALFKEGVTVDGIQIHATRDQDYMVTTLEGRIANVLRVNPKIPMNNYGLAQIGTAGQAVMNQMVAENVLDGEVEAIFRTPDINDISEENQSAHLASGFTGSGKIQNALVSVAIELDVQI